MEGFLLYYKSKGKKPERVKCVLIVGASGNYSDEFLILGKDEESIKEKIKLADIEKLAQYPSDNSWEFGTRKGKNYRFRSEDDYDNKRWFDVLDGCVNRHRPEGRASSLPSQQQQQPPQSSSLAVLASNLSPQRDQINPDGVHSGLEFYNVVIVQPLTEKAFLNKFKLKDTYELSIEKYRINMVNKKDNKDVHIFRAEVIRSFGLMDTFYCLELGRRSAPAYGYGFITLKSTRPNEAEANRVHHHLNELTRREFERLKVEMDELERRRQPDTSFDDIDEEDDDDLDIRPSLQPPQPSLELYPPNQVNEIKYTTVYVPPTTVSKQPIVPPPPSTQYISQPPSQPQTQYLTILKDNADDSNTNKKVATVYKVETTKPPQNQQQQQPPKNEKTTKVEIHRIDATTQQSPNQSYTAQSPYQPNSSYYQYQNNPNYGANKSQTPNYDYINQSNDMNVYRAILVNNTTNKNDDYNRSTQSPPPPSSTKWSTKSQPTTYKSTKYINTTNYTTNSSSNSSNVNGSSGQGGSAGRIGMTTGNNNLASEEMPAAQRTSYMTAAYDNKSGFRIVEEVHETYSETDESFYEERYVPQYMSNRMLPSVALEYFNDDGNSIYGKVKL